MAIDNQWNGIGNLTRDPELRYTPSGTAVLSLDMAINRKFRDANKELVEEVVYVNDITYWGVAAETLGKWATKGMPLFVQGRLTLDTWEDKNTGKNRSRLSVTGEQFKFLGKKGDSEPRDTAAPPQPSPQSSAPAATAATTAAVQEEEEDDIPF